MLGNFEYVNPTKLYFGPKALDYLQRELPKYGNKVVLIYGGGSIKKNGIYDRVMEILKENDKMRELCPIPRPISLRKAQKSLKSTMPICFLPSVAVLSVTMPKA